MDLSVIICTWNNSKRLAITLEAISRCTIPDNINWELVLVNNNCSDNTDDIVQDFTAKLPLQYVHEPKQGLSNARNAGIKAASGRFYIFTDDDVRPYPSWISAYWTAYMEKPSGYYFGGPIDSEFEGQKPDAELLRWAPNSVRGLDLGKEARTLSPNESFIGPNWACPAEILARAGGFNPEYGLDPSSGKVRVGEESNLMSRLREKGINPWYIPDARLYHFVPTDKCTLKHITSRVEAFGFYSANVTSTVNPEREIRRVPPWAYKKCFLLWLNWVTAKIMGKKGYHEYLKWRKSVGTIAGFRDRISVDESRTNPPI